jgi:predicted O-methyltransferase YrrM
MASGPITDVIELYAELDESDEVRLYIDCIDMDPKAVEYAQRKIMNFNLGNNVRVREGDALSYRSKS